MAVFRVARLCCFGNTAFRNELPSGKNRFFVTEAEVRRRMPCMLPGDSSRPPLSSISCAVFDRLFRFCAKFLNVVYRCAPRSNNAGAREPHVSRGREVQATDSVLRSPSAELPKRILNEFCRYAGP